MARQRTDWIDIAQRLDREAGDIQESLPDFRVYCLLNCYCPGHGASFTVGITHKELDITGSGEGRTPTKALEKAKEAFKKKYEEWQRRPRLATSTKALEGGGAS